MIPDKNLFQTYTPREQWRKTIDKSIEKLPPVLLMIILHIQQKLWPKEKETD